VPPGAPDALAAAIEKMLDDPAASKRMGEAGRQLTETLLDVRRTGAAIAGIYEEVIRHHAQAGPSLPI
jgi:glycosyltransferase involved in cell wall biosynthesis